MDHHKFIVQASGDGSGVGPPSNLDVWYNITDLGSLWQDTAGTVPVAASGDPVGRIDDKSGNLHNALQGTAGERPLYEDLDGVFDPTLLSPALSVWYDITDLSTLWQDTAATVPVTISGETVARIDDKSGNLHNALQATSSLRPQYKDL